MIELKESAHTEDTPQFRACPIIRYFANLDAYFGYKVLSELLFSEILNCETVSSLRGGVAQLMSVICKQ